MESPWGRYMREKCEAIIAHEQWRTTPPGEVRKPLSGEAAGELEKTAVPHPMARKLATYQMARRLLLPTIVGMCMLFIQPWILAMILGPLITLSSVLYLIYCIRRNRQKMLTGDTGASQ